MAVDKSGARVRKMFGTIAPKYDRMNHLLSLNVDRYWRWRRVRAVRPSGSDPILDVCTGTGDLAFAFLKRMRGQAEVVAADFCEEMLEIGRRKKTARRYADQISFVAADTQALPFENDRFQVVSVAFGLRNVADTDLGLQEMTRVCRPRGAWRCWSSRRPAASRSKRCTVGTFTMSCHASGNGCARTRTKPIATCPRVSVSFWKVTRWLSG